ncbi:cytochrome P450 [Streptacidiphilus sp. EB103A]|uniref:cytochrome P450 n=1 Tax=Streptacidiphilus sp. EB103A TaxID=3156275 RepID=UPI003510E5E5
MTATTTAPRNIPVAPGAVPGLGHALPMLRDPLGFLTRLPEHGDVVRLRLGPAHVLVVCDPDLFHEVMLNSRVFERGGTFYQRFAEATGNNIGTCPYADHRRYRRLTQPAFRVSRFPGYTSIMADRLDELARGWQDGESFEITSAMMNMTGSLFVSAMFGTGLDPKIVDGAVTSIKDLLAGLYQRIFLPSALAHAPLPANRRCERAMRTLRAMSETIVGERRASGTTDQGDLLSMLMAGQDELETAQFAPLTDVEIMEQVVAFFIAGAETTANALAWALIELSRHPDIEREVAAEARSVVGDGVVRHEHLERLTLCGQVILESIRMYPPGWILTRRASEDTTLGGYDVPRGTTVAVSPYLLHHRPDLFPRPGVFDPYRPEILARRPRGPLVPFGSGPHKCMGDEFALTLSPLALAAITARWSLTPADANPARPITGMLLAPRDLRMTVHRRAD